MKQYAARFIDIKHALNEDAVKAHLIIEQRSKLMNKGNGADHRAGQIGRFTCRPFTTADEFFMLFGYNQRTTKTSFHQERSSPANTMHWPWSSPNHVVMLALMGSPPTDPQLLAIGARAGMNVVVLATLAVLWCRRVVRQPTR